MINHKITILGCCLTVGVLLSGCSDLVVTNVHHAPFSGAMLQVKMTVKNEGMASAPATSTKLEIKPAGSATFTRSLTAPTPALASNNQIEVFVIPLYPHEIPATGSGQCMELKACADSENVASESSEGNNCKTNTTCR